MGYITLADENERLDKENKELELKYQNTQAMFLEVDARNKELKEKLDKEMERAKQRYLYENPFSKRVIEKSETLEQENKALKEKLKLSENSNAILSRKVGIAKSCLEYYRDTDDNKLAKKALEVLNAKGDR